MSDTKEVELTAVFEYEPGDHTVGINEGYAFCGVALPNDVFIDADECGAAIKAWGDARAEVLSSDRMDEFFTEEPIEVDHNKEER